MKYIIKYTEYSKLVFIVVIQVTLGFVLHMNIVYVIRNFSLNNWGHLLEQHVEFAAFNEQAFPSQTT